MWKDWEAYRSRETIIVLHKSGHFYEKNIIKLEKKMNSLIAFAVQSNQLFLECREISRIVHSKLGGLHFGEKNRFGRWVQLSDWAFRLRPKPENNSISQQSDEQIVFLFKLLLFCGVVKATKCSSWRL